MTRPPQSPTRSGARERILLVTMNGLGDCLAFLPVAAAARKLRPGSRVAMMTRRAGAEVAQLTGIVDDCIIVSGRLESGRLSRAREFLQRVRDLRKEKFNLAFMASGESSATAALLFLGGIGTRIGFNDCRLRRLLSVRVEAREPELELRRNLRLLPAAGMPGELARPPCRIPAPLRAEARALLEKSGATGRPRVLIHPGASQPSRRWPARNFAEICSRLARSGSAQPVLACGPAEPGLADEVRRLAAQPVPALPPLLRADLLAAVMSECDLFVGHSSGPLQLAFLLGRPSVSLWGDTDPKLWGPAWEADRHVIVRSPLPCAGCERWDPRRHVVLRGPADSQRADSPPCDKCLEAIPVDEVFEAIRRIIGRPGMSRCAAGVSGGPE